LAESHARWFEVRGGAWTPDAATVAALRASIEESVSDLAKLQNAQLLPWEKYTFQFQGQEIQAERFVLVSALCQSTEQADLADSFVEVLDGGACYFKVRYSPRTRTFYGLAVNGVG
jgi:hypothetical protein